MILSIFKYKSISKEDFLQPDGNLTFSKILRPTQVGWEKLDKWDLKSSEVPCKNPRLKEMSLDVLTQDNLEGELLDPLKTEHKEKPTEFTASMSVPISESQRKVDKSVPTVDPSSPNLTDYIYTLPSPEKPRTKRRHGTDDIIQGVSDERPKQKKVRKRISDHKNPSTVSGTDFKGLLDQNSSEEEIIQDLEETEENPNKFDDCFPESKLEFLLQAVELVSPMTEVSISKEDSPSRDDLI